MFIYPIYYQIGGILVLFIYIYKTRLASNEIFSPSNKKHRKVGRAKDLSAPGRAVNAVLMWYFPIHLLAGEIDLSMSFGKALVLS
jgi:hypothetical protein